LLGYCSRDLRRSLGAARPHVLFLGTCLAVAFPTCWLPPASQSRYFAPLYPCPAVLVGLVVQRCAEVGAPAPLRVGWRWYLTTLAGVMALSGAAVAVGSGLAHRPGMAAWAEPPPVALGYAVVSVALAALTLCARGGGDPFRVRAGVLALAGFMAVTFAGVFTDVRMRRREDTAAAVARLKEQLPPGQRLVSFGHVDALFAYHYGIPIAPRPWPTAGGRGVAGLSYFCFDCPGTGRPILPFAWEEVAAISMDRNHQVPPERVVVVGRRDTSPKRKRLLDFPRWRFGFLSPPR
jgi:hypothetical protein